MIVPKFRPFVAPALNLPALHVPLPHPATPPAIERIGRLRHRVERSARPAAALFADVLAEVGPRGAGRDAPPFETWIETGAFVEAGLALVRHALPGWSLHRLAQDDGLWWCALTPWPQACWNGDDVDETHEDMALVILKAMLAAKAAVLARLDGHEPRRPLPPLFMSSL